MEEMKTLKLLENAGGSGILIVRYQIATIETSDAKASGGNISFYNGKTIHTFTNFWHFCTNPTALNGGDSNPLTVEMIVIGGGGGGGTWDRAGGGGAGSYSSCHDSNGDCISGSSHAVVSWWWWTWEDTTEFFWTNRKLWTWIPSGTPST